MTVVVQPPGEDALWGLCGPLKPPPPGPHARARAAAGESGAGGVK